jgi:hypothetical protein
VRIGECAGVVMPLCVLSLLCVLGDLNKVGKWRIGECAGVVMLLCVLSLLCVLGDLNKVGKCANRRMCRCGNAPLRP